MDENTQFAEYDEIIRDAWYDQAEIELNDLYVEMEKMGEL
jgi:hypothetical protein